MFLRRLATCLRVIRQERPKERNTVKGKVCLMCLTTRHNVCRGWRLAEGKKVRKVNREGQRWTDDRAGMTLRLPLELREAVTEEARVKGDLARIVLFALSHVKRKEVEIQQTRKAGLPLCSPQLLHVGAEARTTLREWAEDEGVSVNAIVVSVLEGFFKQLKRSKALREEFRLEIRASREFLPTWAATIESPSSI